MRRRRAPDWSGVDLVRGFGTTYTVAGLAVARTLLVSSKTVRNTVSGIHAKLRTNDRAEAIVEA